MPERTVVNGGIFTLILSVLAVATFIAAPESRRSEQMLGLFFVTGCLVIGAAIAAPRGP